MTMDDGLPRRGSFFAVVRVLAWGPFAVLLMMLWGSSTGSPVEGYSPGASQVAGLLVVTGAPVVAVLEGLGPCMDRVALSRGGRVVFVVSLVLACWASYFVLVPSQPGDQRQWALFLLWPGLWGTVIFVLAARTRCLKVAIEIGLGLFAIMVVVIVGSTVLWEALSHKYPQVQMHLYSYIITGARLLVIGLIVFAFAPWHRRAMRRLARSNDPPRPGPASR